jgi:tetratricopeptide (TPR) repeat protein
MESGNLIEASRLFEESWRRHIVEKRGLGLKQYYVRRKIILSLRMNSLIEAKEAASEHKAILEKDINKKKLRYDDFAQGMISMAEKNYDLAVESFKKAISLLPSESLWGANNVHAEFIWGLALAYYESGQLDLAQLEFERITALTVGRDWWGSLYAKSFYMLGKIFEQKDWKGKAIENYERFLELWKEADPGLVEVENAKTRLEFLKK